jgi:O-succinylbenzoate synthase
MPELGIGQLQGIALATLEHCTFPTDVEASLRWFRDDIIKSLIEVEDGCIRPMRIEVHQAKLDVYAIARETFGG